MRLDAQYDLVFDLAFPHDLFSEAACDRWGRDVHTMVYAALTDLVAVQGIRAVRYGPNMKLSVRVWTHRMLDTVISKVLAAVMPYTDTGLGIHLEEVDELEKEEAIAVRN